jgi:hypothetical protein
MTEEMGLQGTTCHQLPHQEAMSCMPGTEEDHGEPSPFLLKLGRNQEKRKVTRKRRDGRI